jgi:hypothetical protein
MNAVVLLQPATPREEPPKGFLLALGYQVRDIVAKENFRTH